MPTPDERRALLFVAMVAVLGTAVRGLRGASHPEPGPVDGRAALAAQLANVDSVIAQGGVRPRRTGVGKSLSAAARPAARPAAQPVPRVPDAPVDVDVATSAELERLPGIGPTLAGRIVADRQEHGPFGTLEALRRVRGVGPALTERLRTLVTFSLPPRPSDTEVSARSAARRP